MFGKPRDFDDTETLDPIDGFFGDETAAEAIVEVHDLQHRVEQVEAQINSQFTSLATYAQIAQEQVEMARAEARSATERSEQRLTSLIERERADRIMSFTGEAPAGSAPDVTARLDALEHSVAQIRKGLDECLTRQKALADAITTMFERLQPAESPVDLTEVDVSDDLVIIDESLADADPGIDDGSSSDSDTAFDSTVELETFHLDDSEPIADDAEPASTSAEVLEDDDALPAPTLAPPVLPSPTLASPLSGPIADLSLKD